MAGVKLVNVVLAVVVVGVLVYLVDPTFFGLLKRSSGFAPGDVCSSNAECDEANGEACVDGQCVSTTPFSEGFASGASCSANADCDEANGEACVDGQCVTTAGFKEGFAGSVSNGDATPGQMANPGQVDQTNVVSNSHGMDGDLGTSAFPANFGSTGAPAGCYPRDQLTPAELLPKDQNSVWAEQNPMGPGSLKGKNFLSAGALIGVNTVGQSLRNANWQLRSEPPNPQVPVSIFNQSTIQPDTNRRPLEIN